MNYNPKIRVLNMLMSKLITLNFACKKWIQHTSGPGNLSPAGRSSGFTTALST